jgi:PAS domain S-box-containing protein
VKKLDRTDWETFETIVGTIPNYAIFVIDPEGVILTWNKGAEELKGWSSQEAVGRHFEFLYLDSDRKNGLPSENLKLALQKNILRQEGWRRRKNGDKFLADITISPIRDEKTSEHIGFIKVVADVTKRRQDETERIDDNSLLRKEVNRRKKTEAALKESNSELNAFATAAGHDLQEPLRMVVSYLELIERRYEPIFDNDGREFLHFAIDGASRMKALISDLVEYSRIDSSPKPFKKVNSNDVMKRVLDSLKVSVSETQAVITHDQLPVVYSDEVQLHELFQNLISNAIKFRGEKPLKVHISAKLKNNEYVFCVEDNGKGIAKKDFDRVFLIFKQLGNRIDRSGSGIGLSIARKIINRHGGKIWLDSEVGKGSKFYFSIPLNKENEQ